MCMTTIGTIDITMDYFNLLVHWFVDYFAPQLFTSKFTQAIIR